LVKYTKIHKHRQMGVINGDHSKRNKSLVNENNYITRSKKLKNFAVSAKSVTACLALLQH